jgi:hypothetical protein
VALLLPKSRILHVPKTGGTWLRQAVLAAVPGAQEFRIGGSTHATLAQVPCPERFTIAFVRHPLTWWLSFWRFHMGPARPYVVDHEICSTCWSDDFVAFLWNVVRRFPGECYRNALAFVGPPEREIEFIGRQENLVEDLIAALRQAGEEFDERLLRSVPPANVSDRGVTGRYTPELARAVLAAEAEHLQRFGYGQMPTATR